MVDVLFFSCGALVTSASIVVEVVANTFVGVSGLFEFLSRRHRAERLIEERLMLEIRKQKEVRRTFGPVDSRFRDVRSNGKIPTPCIQSRHGFEIQRIGTAACPGVVGNLRVQIRVVRVGVWRRTPVPNGGTVFAGPSIGLRESAVLSGISVSREQDLLDVVLILYFFCRISHGLNRRDEQRHQYCDDCDDDQHFNQ